jgi:hypothetical protein
MDETFRMLGREHEADLERDAEKWRHAAEARGHEPIPELDSKANRRRSRSRNVMRARIAALRVRGASAGG